MRRVRALARWPFGCALLVICLAKACLNAIVGPLGGRSGMPEGCTGGAVDRSLDLGTDGISTPSGSFVEVWCYAASKHVPRNAGIHYLGPMVDPRACGVLRILSRDVACSSVDPRAGRAVTFSQVARALPSVDPRPCGVTVCFVLRGVSPALRGFGESDGGVGMVCAMQLWPGRSPGRAGLRGSRVFDSESSVDPPVGMSFRCVDSRIGLGLSG